jgi:hypothetical protein
MKAHKADKTDYLLIDDLLSKLVCWGNDAAFHDAMDKHIDININNLRERSNKNTIKVPEHKKPKLKVKGGGKPAPRQFESVETFDEKPKRYLPNKSKQYLKLAKQKEDEEERALAMNIEK